MNRKRRMMAFIALSMPIVLVQAGQAAALEDDEIIKILSKNSELFVQNSIDGNVFRAIGWGIMKFFAFVAGGAEEVYEKCFDFIDFTTYKGVTNYISKYQVVWVAIFCLALLCLGVVLILWHDKKPKLLVNMCIAVLVVSSSTFLISKMNALIGKEVRTEIMEGSNHAVVYKTIGSNIHDLLYIDNRVGLDHLNKKSNGVKNSKLTYEEFTKKDFNTLNITEIIEPDDVREDSEDIADQCLLKMYDDEGKSTYELADIYDGVAWTDLLNEYYYRYTVDWVCVYMELFSEIVIFLFMAYKVIRTIYEIAIKEMLAYLYSANINGGQKILKILDSIKDAYIILLVTMVSIKFYQLACKYISGWDIGGAAKGFILVFIAFAVIDGPNIIQQLTGQDAGGSDGLGKAMTLFYATSMASQLANMGGNAAKKLLHPLADGAAKMNFGMSAFNKSQSHNKNKGVPPEEGASSGTEKKQGDKEKNPNQDNQNPETDNRKEDTKNASEDNSNIEDGQNGNLDAAETGSNIPEDGIGAENSTMPPEQGEAFGEQEIGDISKKEDALNGNAFGTEKPSDSMEKMEKDLSENNYGFAGSESQMADSSPLEFSGSMFQQNGSQESGQKEGLTSHVDSAGSTKRNTSTIVRKSLNEDLAREKKERR